MNKLINPFKGLLFFALAAAPLFSLAVDGENVEKKRTISKTYNVGSDDLLKIDNSFGNVTITTWTKNVIQVDIEIGVRAPSDEKAQKMMDQIDVKDNQEGKNILFKTEIGKMSGNSKNNGNEDGRKFYVDYKVSMPAGNPIEIENQFGKTEVPDMSGQVSLTSKFGELTTGKISNARLIHVEFGKANIGQLTNADVVFKFNSNTNVAGVSGNTKMDVQFCSHVNVVVNNSVSELALYQSYSTINLQVSDNLSAKFDVYTNFGSFKNSTAFHISEENQNESSGPKFDKNYSGSSGSGASKIKIKSSFGSVRLADVKDKSVSKGNDDDKDEDDKDDDKTDVNM